MIWSLVSHAQQNISINPTIRQYYYFSHLHIYNFVTTIEVSQELCVSPNKSLTLPIFRKYDVGINTKLTGNLHWHCRMMQKCYLRRQKWRLCPRQFRLSRLTLLSCQSNCNSTQIYQSPSPRSVAFPTSQGHISDFLKIIFLHFQKHVYCHGLG